MNGSFGGKQEHMIYCFPLKYIGIERDRFFPFTEMGCMSSCIPIPSTESLHKAFDVHTGYVQLKDASSQLGSRTPFVL